ncbi:MAG TPA: UDP-N-acetylmuramoyl-L-alanyl-D-glutamate--2,6-diaminopimelate ligase [Opitutales bacterium]|nr:UDP-N-acetylmuramoyl-L-alanyl-D-glutamate--2,6-diaminopimelate ligase [Opitutales bacterium]
MIGFANLENSLGVSPFLLAARLAAVAEGERRGRARMDHSLKNLLAGTTVLALRGDSDRAVTCLVTDSRRVVPGALFFAIEGTRVNGADYIEEAVGRGAVAVVSARAPSKFTNVAWAQVLDVRVAMAEVARRFYRSPDDALFLTGVTGTNGKTTVSMMTQFLLNAPDAPCGLIGTVRYEIGQRTLPSYKTTPESVDLFALFDQMREAGCQSCAMEVSSHALVQSRVHGVRFDAVAFTNLTQDHLDYHESLENYFNAKARLFTGESGYQAHVAVINIDDPYGRVLVERLPAGVETVTYGFSASASLRAVNVVLSPGGSQCEVEWAGGRARLTLNLPGRYNILNALCALGLAQAAGRDLALLVPRLAHFTGVPGRMEKIEAGQPYQVLVDYAHTDDALSHALTMLRDVCAGRLLVVFGCGGNRDRAKRPRMTAAVQRWADFAWATADNPRKEPLAQIFDDMRTGVTAPTRIRFVDDRRRAIALALEAAQPGDCVLIAGKGHETYQEFADTVVPFDDRQVARELLMWRHRAAANPK